MECLHSKWLTICQIDISPQRWQDGILPTYVCDHKWPMQNVSRYVIALSTIWGYNNKSLVFYLYGREPWSSGNGKRLVFRRSWVQILTPYTLWTYHFSHIFVVGIVMFVWKDENKPTKEAEDCPFLNLCFIFNQPFNWSMKKANGGDWYWLWCTWQSSCSYYGDL